MTLQPFQLHIRLLPLQTCYALISKNQAYNLLLKCVGVHVNVHMFLDVPVSWTQSSAPRVDTPAGERQSALQQGIRHTAIPSCVTSLRLKDVDAAADQHTRSAGTHVRSTSKVLSPAGHSANAWHQEMHNEEVRQHLLQACELTSLCSIHSQLV